MQNELELTIPYNEKYLAATFSLPNTGEIKSAVLLLHGWVSHRDEVGGFYAQLAQSLAQQGIASLRFDFYGCGDSSPEFLCDLTIPSMLEDAKNALDYLKIKMGNKISIGVCGFSLGAAIMALLMEKKGQCIQSVVGLSPVVNLTRDFAYQHKRLIDLLLAKSPSDNAPIEYDLGWRKIAIQPEFVRQFSEFDNNISESWKNYTGAGLAVGGELDFSGDTVNNFAKITPNCRLLERIYLPKTDHIFNILAETDNKAPMVIEIVTKWFVKTLAHKNDASVL